MKQKIDAWCKSLTDQQWEKYWDEDMRLNRLKQDWEESRRRDHKAFINYFPLSWRHETRIRFLETHKKNLKEWLLLELKRVKLFKTTEFAQASYDLQCQPIENQIRKVEKEIRARETLKEEKDLEAYRDIPIQRLLDLSEGKNLKIRCPFHKEKTGSFHLYKEGHAHCFGCSLHFNNALDFMMKWKNVPFKEALKLLEKDL